MKPNFALTLSFDGISLLHRAFPGWNSVGDVALDTDDLPGDLAALRETAKQLDPTGLRTKLVLPNDQVKYLQIDAQEQPEEAVRAALKQATPYAVDDLAYDWTERDGQIYIAAVARETLAEAEAFALDHKFNPVSLVGRPANGEYAGEPYFGATQNSRDQGLSDEDIERDTAPIRVIGSSRLPDEVAPEPAETEEPPEAEDSEVPPPVEPEGDDPSEPWPELEKELDAEFAKERDAEVTAAEPGGETEVPTETDIEPVSEDAAEIDATQSREAEPKLVDAPDADPEPEPEITGAPDHVADPEIAADPTDEPDPEQAATPDEEPRDDTESQPAPITAFTSIRALRGAQTGAARPKLDGVKRGAAPPSAPPGLVIEDDIPESAASVIGVADAALPEMDVTGHEIRPVAEDKLAHAAAAADDLPESAPAQTVSDNVLPPAPEPAFEHERAASMPASDPEPRPSALSFFTRRARKPAAIPATGGSTAFAQPEDERQRMTVFGARDKAAVGGKPRFLGLMLTAVLLLFLIGVAAWASIFLDDGIARFFREDDSPVVATLPAPSEEDAVELASLQSDEPLPVLEDPATAILSRVSPADLSPDEAMARYAATGIWQLAPEPPAAMIARDLEDFYQTSLDPDPDFGDAVALPGVVAAFSDGMFFTPPSPPAADTTFTLDPRGFVLATPDGALTPDGVRVFAGLPDVTMPAALRGGIKPEAEPETPEVTAQLAAFRPRARPADVVEQIERNELSGRTASELAALRPKLRPESAQEAAEEARKAAEAEAAGAQAEAEAAAAAQASTVDLDALQGAIEEAVAEPDPFAGATAQAVQASLKPKTPPRNFDNIVQRTKQNQQRQEQAAEESQPVRVAAAQKVTPNIPSAASVSKAATERNALRFQRVNLIGVYGTTSNRRALVRMSNGRYKKVKVGDRLDGGTVRAIGDSELRYQKGGRNVILKMPRG